MQLRCIRRRPLLVALSMLALLTSACTGTVGGRLEPDAGSRPDEAYEQLLPRSVLDSGVIRIGADASTPPYLFVGADGELDGLELDFMQALSDEIGVEVEVVATTFSGLVPSLLSGRIDAGMSNFSDTIERQEHVDFVDYTRSADLVMVRRGNPHRVTSTEDLCGLRVSATQGTTSAAGTAASSEACVDEGRRPITILLVPSLGDTLIQVQSGRADALVTDQAQVIFQQQRTDGMVEPAGDLTGPNFHGIATKKGNDGLRDALLLAFEELFQNGTYEELLAKWGQSQLAIDQPTVNAEGKNL